MEKLQLTFKPLSPEYWEDFVGLFGKNGACGGCWCMSFRLKNADFKTNKGDFNKNSMKELMEHQMTGILAFHQNQAIAWCAMSPREEYLRLENSKILRRVDDKQVWSIPCFFILKSYRRKGVSVEMLKAAIDYARDNGIKILEGYPIIPYDGKMPDVFAWSGIVTSYERAGFKIVAKNSKSKWIARYEI
jgi:GNAT superfamily N-acetyltransferase